MLTEIFLSLKESLESHFQLKNISLKKVRIKIGNDKEVNNKTLIRMEVVRFGMDMQHANFVQGTLSDKIYYAFTFFITIDGNDYEQNLDLIETIAGFFEKKPFHQLKLKESEYECGISPQETSFSDINHFWIAQQRKHQPVLFYQARISEV